jgi:hypothetical protein
VSRQTRRGSAGPANAATSAPAWSWAAVRHGEISVCADWLLLSVSCLPIGCRCGNCEQRRLAPFVRYFNRSTGASFEFERTLDTTGPTPQPEASYVDRSTGALLVVERKSLIWPRDFAQLHTTWHEVSEIVDDLLDGVLDPRRAYRLTLRGNLRGTRPQLRAYAAAVARAITKGMSSVHDGIAVVGKWPDREWRFREESRHERDLHRAVGWADLRSTC